MQEPIRILMLFTVMNRGGAETMVMNYYRNIDRTKVQFDFMVHRKERGAYDDEIEALGGKIYRMMPLHPFTFGKYQKQIAAFFDEHSEYKIIHGHCSESGYFVYKEAHKRGIPVIIAHAHNSHALYDAKWPFRTYFKHAMRKYVTQIFTCGKEAALWLAGHILAQTAILQRNSIDTKVYAFSEKRREAMRRELGIPTDAIVIGHVGRFNKQKNHAFLIDIFQAFVQQHPQTHLVLVGVGELMEEIKAKVKALSMEPQVHFLGVRSDVPALLHAMDLFLFPSFMEGLSVSMVEAQCAGLPCVVSDTIPMEVSMTDLVSFIPLNAPMEKWVNSLNYHLNRDIDRESYPDFITHAGYDIQRNAEWLQEYYLEQYKQHCP